MYSAARSSRCWASCLRLIRQAGVLDAVADHVEPKVVPVRLHDPLELADVGGLVPDRAHEEPPVLGPQLARSELQRQHGQLRVLKAPLLQLVGGHQDHDIVQRRWRATVPDCQVADLRLVRSSARPCW